MSNVSPNPSDDVDHLLPSDTRHGNQDECRVRSHLDQNKPTAAREISTSPLDIDMSSGASSVANYSQWFEQINANPDRIPAKFADDGSPYFVHSCSSNEDEKSSHNVYLPAQANGSKSSDDDFRSVIDDLTIQNKKLKEKLRQYKKKSSIFLEKDKLFELRIHSLPTEKRRELEAALQSFASSLNGSTYDHNSAPFSSTTVSANNKSSSPTRNHSIVPSSFNISTIPSVHSSNIPTKNIARKMISPVYPEPPSQTEIRGKIKYSSTAKSLNLNQADRQKRKMVVKRLERLFTGKEAATVENDTQILSHIETYTTPQNFEHPIAHSRAPTREAYMNTGSDDKISRPIHRKKKSKAKESDSCGSSDQTVSDNTSVEQRPTYILDLDPDRAQIPSENVEYIRHLGFESVVLSDIDSIDSEKTKGPWIYLNLLINMAQLHIINVTPDFVRSAVAEVSEKFEVSPDGQMLRWRGGSNATNLSSDTGASSEHESENQESLDQAKPKSRSRRFNPVDTHSAVTETESSSKSKNFHYQPLFRYHASSRSCSESNDSLGSEEEIQKVGGNNSQSRQSWPQTTGRTKADGLIVFYNDAEFCTDLSGETLVFASPTDAPISEDSFMNDAKISSIHSSMTRTNSGSTLSYRPFKAMAENIVPVDSEEYVSCKSDVLHDSKNDLKIISTDLLLQNDQVSSPITLNEAFGASIHTQRDRFQIEVITRRSKIASRLRAASTNQSSLSTSESLGQSMSARLASLPVGIRSSTPRHKPSITPQIQTNIVSVRYKSIG